MNGFFTLIINKQNSYYFRSMPVCMHVNTFITFISNFCVYFFFPPDRPYGHKFDSIISAYKVIFRGVKKL